ncbi:PA21B Phospholipase, partial [Atractosteus spatula]|nr:PA21B Phospholipase [Atractosteus spatula]
PLALWQFGEMIKCTQPGRNPLDYNQYGCWCGFGGTGTPLDQVDSCCYTHDYCYKASRKLPACRPLVDLPYIKQYNFSCSGAQVSCGSSNDPCQAFVCECDRAAAHCFAQAGYNPQYKDLDKDLYCASLSP